MRTVCKIAGESGNPPVYMRQICMSTVGDIKSMEAHYADMAEKGWMIDKIGLFTHRYRAVEPCKKRFFVDLLPQITAFDYPENEDAQEYRRICGESGWTFIAANKQFHVFCADDENPAPIPIHTDNAIHAKIYLRACRKYELPWFLFALIMLWFFSPLGKGVELFLSNVLLFMAIGQFLFYIGYVWVFGFVISWYIRTKKAAKNDLPMPCVNRHISQLRGKVFVAGVIAFVACMVIGIVLEISGGMPPGIALTVLAPILGVVVGFRIRRKIDTKRRTRAANIKLTVIVITVSSIIIGCVVFFAGINMSFTWNSDSLDGRPVLKLNAVGVTTPPNNSNILVRGTPMVPVAYEYWEINREGIVRTQVSRAVNKALARWLYERFSEEFIHDFRDILSRKPGSIAALSSDEAALWGAEKGMTVNYENSVSTELLLLKDKTILLLSAEGLTMNFMNQAVRNLWPE